MSDSNWGWIESINPSGTLNAKLSKGRYTRRLGSFWDLRVAREARPVCDEDGNVIVRKRVYASQSKRSSAKKRPNTVIPEHRVKEFIPHFADKSNEGRLVFNTVTQQMEVEW